MSSLKFSDKRQTFADYGDARRLSDPGGRQGPAGNLWNRFPQGSQPIATAPERSGTPVWVMRANGQGDWALHHNGAWQKLAPFKDFRDGTVRWRMSGELIPNPVAWAMPQRKK